MREGWIIVAGGLLSGAGLHHGDIPLFLAGLALVVGSWKS